MVPKGWQAVCLDDVSSKVAVGLAISVTPFMREAGVKLIRNQNIKRNKFNSESIVYLDNDFALENKSKMVRVGDIIAVRTGSNIGEACVVPTEFDGALTFTTLIVRPVKEKLSSYFLATHMNSTLGVSEVNRLMAGGGKPNLNSGELKNYQLLLPPLPEQLKIAQILSTWDKAIATTERLLANKQQQKKALMQRLLTGKQRFAGFEGEWIDVLLGDIATLTAGGTPSTSNPEFWGGDIPWMSSGEIHHKQVYSVAGRITHEGLSSSSTKILPLNCLLIALAGQGKTRGTVALNKVELCTNQSIAAAIFNKQPVIPEFIFHNMDNRYDELRSLSTGDGGRGGLNLSILRNVKIQLPSIEGQKKIALTLSLADTEIITIQKQIDNLKQQKKALMQQLLTGKCRVTVNEVAA